MVATVVIENLECEVCKNFVIKEAYKLKGILNVVIDLDTKHLHFYYKTHNAMEGFRMRLAEIGYPITKDPSVINGN